MKRYKIIWAMNPMDEDRNVFKRACEMIKSIQKKHIVQVIPVYVMNPDIVNWAGQIPLKELKKFSGDVSLKMEKELKALKNIHCALPEILFNTDTSTSKSVKKLLGFAKSHSADAILTVSHSRSEIENMFLGSFTEKLLVKTNIPLIIVPNSSKSIGTINKIAFPVDLAVTNSSSYKCIANFSKMMKANLNLVHKLPNPVDPLLQHSSYMLGGGWISIGEFFKQDTKQRKENLGKLKARLEKQGGKVSMKVLDGPGSIAGEVKTYMDNKKIPMLAINTSSKSRASYIVGSVARSIIKETNRPVILLHQ